MRETSEAAGAARPSRPSRREAAFLAGMAFFWPAVSSNRLSPTALLAAGGAGSTVSSSISSADLVGVAALLAGAAALVAAFRVRPASARRLLAPLLVGADALLAASLAGFALAGGAVAGSGAARACVAALSGAYFLLLSAGWACVAEEASGESRRLLVLMLLSLAAAVPLVWAAQSLAAAAGLAMASGEALLSLVSGPFCAALVARPGPADCAPAQAAAGSDGSSGAPAWRRAASAPATAMWAAIVVYLLLTSVLRVVSMVGMEPDEPLTKSVLSKAMLEAFALCMLAAAAKGGGALDGLGRAWAVFAVASLAVLYASIAFYQASPWLCREVVFPSRMCAYALLFLLAVGAARQARLPAAPLACLFFPGVLAVSRLVIVGTYALASRDPGAVAGLVLPVTAATALAMTACVAWALYRALSSAERPGSPAARGEGAASDAGSTVAAAADLREAACRAIAEEFSLNEREEQVLMLLSLGYSQRRVAEELGLAQNTVHSYAKGLYAKAGIHGRQDAVDLVAARMEGAG